MFGKLTLLFVMACIVCNSHAFKTHLSYIHGEITSDNFTDGFYPNNLDQSLDIKVKPGYVIALYFEHFNIEEGSGDKHFVCGDFVELIDGTTNATIVKMCGNSAEIRPYAPVLMEQKFRSSSNLMTIRMKTDHSNVGIEGQSKPTGFRAYYCLEDIDECELQSAKIFDSIEDDTNCQQRCINYPGGFQCACDIGYNLAEDGRSCYADASACNTFDSTAPTGTIVPPMYKGSYARNITCAWKLKANTGENIYLNFAPQFDVEAYQGNVCLYDFVKIEDHGGVKGTFCGANAPAKTIKSTTDWMMVTFYSDYFVEGSGFTINYQSEGVRCRVPKLPLNSFAVNAPPASSDGYSYLQFGAQLKIRCNDGFWLEGNSKLNCLKDGSYSSKLPKCLAL